MRKRMVAMAVAIGLGSLGLGVATHQQRVAHAQTVAADEAVDHAMSWDDEQPAISHPQPAARIHPSDVARAAGLTDPGE
jgi:hypothetical protein